MSDVGYIITVSIRCNLCGRGIEGSGKSSKAAEEQAHIKLGIHAAKEHGKKREDKPS